MKKILVTLGLLFTLGSYAADVKLSALPLGVGANTVTDDSFPYVDSAAGVTRRLRLSDIVNIPSVNSTYAHYTPNQFGVLLSGTGSLMHVLAPSTSGLPLVSTGTSSDPSWQLLQVPGGGTGISSVTTNGILYGAGSSLATSGAGTQYQVLRAGVTGAPAFGQINLDQSAAITGTLPNSNTTATASNVLNTIVLRDGSSNFSAGTITASLTGTASGNLFYKLAASNHGVVLSGSSTAAVVLGPDSTSTKYLGSNGSSTDPSWKTFTVPTIQQFTSSSGTYTTPANVRYIRVRMVGGGGGGGSSGTTGGGNATNGGNTTFGTSLLVANGGVGSSFSNQNDGVGGTATITGPTGLAFQGASGQGGQLTSAVGTPGLGGGQGGSSSFGGAGAGGGTNQNGTNAITNTGSGGGGGGISNTASDFSGSGGGAGGYVDCIITSPSASYTYAVGSAGAGGSAGTSGKAGGNGAAGIIMVEEFYQ